MKKILFCLLTLFTLASLTGSSKETILITVQADKTGAEIRPAMYASSSLDRKNGKLYVKIVNLNEKPVPVRLDLGRLQYTKNAVHQTLKSGKKQDLNSVSGGELIKPVTTPVRMNGRRVDATMEPLSVNVLIIDFKAI